MRLTSVYVRPWNSVLNLLKWEENPRVKFNFSSQAFLNLAAIKKCILFSSSYLWRIRIQILRCIFTFSFNILFQLWKLNLLPGKHFSSSIFLCHTKYILQIPPNFAHFSQNPEIYIFRRQNILFPNWFNIKIRRQTVIRSVSLFQAKQAAANVQNNKTETNPNFEDVKIQETWLLFDDEESLKFKSRRRKNKVTLRKSRLSSGDQLQAFNSNFRSTVITAMMMMKGLWLIDKHNV